MGVDTMLVDGGKTVVVVLDGVSVLTKRSGVAPLRYALRDLAGPEDEVLVLNIFNSASPPPLSPINTNSCCLGKSSNGNSSNRNPPAAVAATAETDSYFWFLCEQIKQNEEHFMRIFRPFYDKCKANGVKLLVKIAAGQPNALIVEGANSAGAVWAVIDSCFARVNGFNLKGINCNISFSEDGELVVPSTDGSEVSARWEPKPNSNGSNKWEPYYQQKEPRTFWSSPKFEHYHQPLDSLRASTSREGEIFTWPETSEGMGNNLGKVNVRTEKTLPDNIIMSSTKCSEVNHVLGMPLQLTWEVISEITARFKNIVCVDQNNCFQMFMGYLPDHHAHVLVQRFNGDFSDTLEAEKKAALSMYHKNIMGLFGYHKNENATVLIFPYTTRGTLDKYLNGMKGKQTQLAFNLKMNIAIGIAQGLRYMHEECPRGPVVHRELHPCNIYLRHDFQPQISGFGEAAWLQLEQSSLISNNRCCRKDPLDHESLALVKSDILSFGILLLRLFSKRSAALDNKKLLQWARPLLRQRAYHELFDEETDLIGIYRVTYTADQCIKTKQTSRPCMGEVVAFLKGETSCAVLSSPSSDGSPHSDLYRLLNL